MKLAIVAFVCVGALIVSDIMLIRFFVRRDDEKRTEKEKDHFKNHADYEG